jgi:hypothetical protein
MVVWCHNVGVSVVSVSIEGADLDAVLTSSERFCFAVLPQVN